MPSLKANCRWEGEGRARELGCLMKLGDLPRRRVVQKGSRTPRGHTCPSGVSSGLRMRGTESRGAEEPQGGLGGSREEPGQEVRMSETVTQAEP